MVLSMAPCGRLRSLKHLSLVPGQELPGKDRGDRMQVLLGLPVGCLPAPPSWGKQRKFTRCFLESLLWGPSCL